MELKKTLKALKKIQKEPCVSILLSTHRTHPDNAQDPINLKNLVAQAEERMLTEYEKRHVWPVMERINAAVATIDHNRNLEGMALFANPDMAEVVQLPVAVTDRVVLDRNFATRDLMRALQSSAHYYVLTLSGNLSRLIEGYRSDVVEEFGSTNGFPIENRFYNTHADQRSNTHAEANLMREFFNRLDKLVQQIHAQEPLPVILAGDDRTVDYFMEVADRKDMYIGRISGSPDGCKAHELTGKAYAEIERLRNERQLSALEDIRKAQGAGKLLDDVGDIYRAAQEGRADTLYVETGYYQPATVIDNVVSLKDDQKEPGVLDDIIDEIAEITMKFGGHVVFLPEGSLAKYRKVCLSTRF
ncbi:MAG: hypothetical protein JNM31_14080 [Flavobacteriales bacterium]|nr:hypothetical protein [Flavobacteriales bacterium]